MRRLGKRGKAMLLSSDGGVRARGIDRHLPAKPPVAAPDAPVAPPDQAGLHAIQPEVEELRDPVETGREGGTAFSHQTAYARRKEQRVCEGRIKEWRGRPVDAMAIEVGLGCRCGVSFEAKVPMARPVPAGRNAVRLVDIAAGDDQRQVGETGDVGG